MAEKLLKPAEFAEKQLIERILGKAYQPGDPIPAERVLAAELGVTRPTLRETLQRLSKEGWITIRHGKPTCVNHYLEDGGLNILNSLVKHQKYLSAEMVAHLLEVRTTLLPDIAQKAASNDRVSLSAVLSAYECLSGNPIEFAKFDWALQMQMVLLSRNPVFKMIFNDFAPLYEILGKAYFKSQKAKSLSLSYYEKLMTELKREDPKISAIVRQTLIKTQELWQEL